MEGLFTKFVIRGTDQSTYFRADRIEVMRPKKGSELDSRIEGRDHRMWYIEIKVMGGYYAWHGPFESREDAEQFIERYMDSCGILHATADEAYANY